MKKMKSILQKNINIICTLLFAAFMLLQLVTLRMANQAGRGFLAAEIQDKVYLFIQIIVIMGIICHMILYRLISRKVGYGGAAAALSGMCAVGAEVMLFADTDSAAYLAVSAVTVLCLGFVCGAVYLKLSELISAGARPGACIGVGYALAVALQYAFQLSRTIKPVLALFALLSALGLAYCFLHTASNDEPQPEKRSPCVQQSKLIFLVVVTFAMLIFTNFYNIYIHHLQIATGYTEYNVYSWPRLLMIPMILLFGFVGDLKGGKFLPISCLCTVVLAMLIVVLPGREMYLTAMCLYYISITAVIAYYNMSFPRIAQKTERPALWAVMGRIIDSFFVIITFMPGFSELPAVAVLAMDIAALCVIIVFMALSGDLVFAAQKELRSEPADPFGTVAAKFGISPSEMKVLRELVLTDDKQDAIALRLNISVSTLRHHITSIYKKTGTSSRIALHKLVDGARNT